MNINGFVSSHPALSKLGLGLAVLVVGILGYASIALAAGNYVISGNVSISGTTVTLSGTASANPYTGQSSAQKIAVDWTGSCSSANATTISFTSITFTGGNGGPDGHNNGNFNGATWSTSHTYPTPGTYSACVKVHHGSFSGAEGSDAATFNATIVIPPAQGGLIVQKVVVNTGGGTAVAGDFQISVKSATSSANVPGSPAAGTTSGKEYTLAVGSYNVSEPENAAYATTFSGNCGSTGLVSVMQGATSTCVVTNTYKPATLTVTKIVTNDNGGTAQVADFTLKVDNATVASGESNSFAAGAHVVSETGGPSGYAATFGGDCDASGNVTLAHGVAKSCTITNNDIAPKLTVTKTVINDGPDTPNNKVIADFTLFVGATQVLSGVQNPFSVGIYAITETGAAGYSASFGGDCTGGSVTLGLGDVKSCTITNNDNGIPPPPTENTLALCTDGQDNDGDDAVDLNDSDCAGFKPKLTVTKVVTNDDGGNAVVSDFPLFVNQTSVTSGIQSSFNPGAYLVSETSEEGYVGAISGDCDANGNITLAAGDVKSCTITNNDQPAKITIIKTANGGNGTFTFNVTGMDAFQIQTTDGSGTATIEVDAGTYQVTEPNTEGWNFNSVSCIYDGKSIGNVLEDLNGESVTLGSGDEVTCTFVNTKIVPPPQCSDGLDNDGDGKTDFSSEGGDPNCSSAEDNSEAPDTPQCSDAIDNDGDGLSDTNDPGCHYNGIAWDPLTYDPNDNNETDPTPPTNTGGGGGGGNGPIGAIGFGGGGSVLGAATSTLPELPAGCSALLSGYMRQFRIKNNPEEVKKLQEFLNSYMNAGLPVTGVFGPMTDAAVRAFQEKHKNETLTPWGLKSPTGFVYLTTQRWINLMHCSSLTIPVPELVPFTQ